MSVGEAGYVEKSQICREQSRANAVWGGGAGERYVIHPRLIAGLTAETSGPTDVDNNVT